MPTMTTTKVRALPRQTCVWHCAGCESHFHSLRAFEAHRQDMRCVPPSEATASKGTKAGRFLLSAWTDEGWCSLQTGCKRDGVVVNWLHPITIWQAAGHVWQGPMS